MQNAVIILQLARAETCGTVIRIVQFFSLPIIAPKTAGTMGIIENNKTEYRVNNS